MLRAGNWCFVGFGLMDGSKLTGGFEDGIISAAKLNIIVGDGW